MSQASTDAQYTRDLVSQAVLNGKFTNEQLYNMLTYAVAGMTKGELDSMLVAASLTELDVYCLNTLV